ALHSWSRLLLHQAAGRCRCRASSPSPTSSQYPQASTSSSRSNRAAVVTFVCRSAQPVRRLLSSRNSSSTAIRRAYNAVNSTALPGRSVIRNHGSSRLAVSPFFHWPRWGSGLGNRDIASRVGFSPQWVRTIIHRFNEDGLYGILWYPWLHAVGRP